MPTRPVCFPERFLFQLSLLLFLPHRWCLGLGGSQICPSAQCSPELLICDLDPRVSRPESRGQPLWAPLLRGQTRLTPADAPKEPPLCSSVPRRRPEGGRGRQVRGPSCGPCSLGPARRPRVPPAGGAGASLALPIRAGELGPCLLRPRPRSAPRARPGGRRDAPARAQEPPQPARAATGAERRIRARKRRRRRRGPRSGPI